MSVRRIAVVGAGVAGRLLALRASALGYEVTLYDKGAALGGSSASSVAAGMLAPGCELDAGSWTLYELGIGSLEAWPEILREFSLDVFFQSAGSIVVAHHLDRPELARMQRNLEGKGAAGSFRRLDQAQLRDLEPGLSNRFHDGLFFPIEGQIDAQGFLQKSLEALRARGVRLRFECEATDVRPFVVGAGGKLRDYDMVFDCRGLGARREIDRLRAVRGEIVWVQAPEVSLRRPIRLLHPRHPVYIVPRPQNLFAIGATAIESADQRPITVRSALELLSAACTVNDAFAEATIVRTAVGLRPALPSNEPKILSSPGLVRLNGLYRHGFMVSPQLVETALELLREEVPA